MDSIAKYIDEKRDVGFLIGFDKGEATARERELTKVVSNLLQKLNLPFEQIADIAGVTVDFVKSVQRKISTN